MPRSAMGTGAPGAIPHLVDAPALVLGLVARYDGQPVQPAPQDVYKLLYHAALGSEHAVADPAAAERWMHREVAGLQPLDLGPVEPVVEPLGRFARVHLRPYLTAGGTPPELLAAFLRTAGISVPRSVLHLALARALEVAEADGAGWPWSADSLRAFFDAQRERGDPAVHHSPAFAAAYRPAYRVVHADELPGLLRGLRLS